VWHPRRCYYRACPNQQSDPLPNLIPKEIWISSSSRAPRVHHPQPLHGKVASNRVFEFCASQLISSYKLYFVLLYPVALPLWARGRDALGRRMNWPRGGQGAPPHRGSAVPAGEPRAADFMFEPAVAAEVQPQIPHTCCPPLIWISAPFTLRRGLGAQHIDERPRQACLGGASGCDALVESGQTPKAVNERASARNPPAPDAFSCYFVRPTRPQRPTSFPNVLRRGQT
jgi:hypothetical protein